MAGATVVITAVGLQTSVLAKSSTLTVGNGTSPSNCHAQYPSINAAVAAAAPGDTIKVCAGNYPEHVMVAKPLTFQGAQSGGDARSRHDMSKETIVDNVNGDFTLSAGADNVTIDGFTITGAGADPNGANDYGIEAFGGTSGLTVVNDVIAGNRWGINMQNPNGNEPAVIRHNAFVNNTTTGPGACAPADPCSGTGVFISNGPANSTSINENFFTGDTQTAINFAGSSSPSVGLSVTHNESYNDATFVVATNSKGAVISDNEVDVTASSNGTAILDYGSNVNLSITHNMISGGNAAGTSGINLRALSGTPSVNTQVKDNQVSGRYNGVRLTDGANSDTVSNNHIMNSSHDGIFMQQGANNSFVGNHVETSATHDCEDDQPGANTWSGNMGKSNNSSPPSICPSH